MTPGPAGSSRPAVRRGPNRSRRRVLDVALGVGAVAIGLGADFNVAPTRDARILRIDGSPAYEVTNYKTDILSVYNSGGNQQRTLIEFDLGAVVLEPGQRLATATLTLTASTGFGGSGGQPMEIYQVSRPWTEDGVTWRNAAVAAPWSRGGGDYVGLGHGPEGRPFAVSTASPSNLDPVTWNVTGLVDEWIEGIAPNYGLLLTSRPGNALVFFQRESGQPQFRPVLRLTTESGPPRLRIAPDPATGMVVLFWRGVGTAVLQESAGGGAAPDWSDSPLPVTAEQGRSVVKLIPAVGQRLFRLRSS